MKKRFSKQDGYSTASLLQYAHDHLACAKVLFNRSYDCFDSAGYLSHLGIELILKTFILFCKGSFPAEHDLIKLLGEIKSCYPKFYLERVHEQMLIRINTFMGIRYPKPNDPLGIGSEDWEAIKELSNTLILQMPATLQRELLERECHKKGGRILMRKPIDTD